jgi:hypothetical protein
LPTRNNKKEGVVLFLLFTLTKFYEMTFSSFPLWLVLKFSLRVERWFPEWFFADTFEIFIQKQDFRFTYECPFSRWEFPCSSCWMSIKRKKGSLFSRLQLNCLLIYLIKVLLIYSWISDCTLPFCPTAHKIVPQKLIFSTKRVWDFNSHVKFIAHNILLGEDWLFPWEEMLQTSSVRWWMVSRCSRGNSCEQKVSNSLKCN